MLSGQWRFGDWKYQKQRALLGSKGMHGESTHCRENCISPTEEGGHKSEFFLNRSQTA